MQCGSRDKGRLVARCKAISGFRPRAVYLPARRSRSVAAPRWVAPRPSHPETCPRCGKLTWNWKYLQSRAWFECEHCGFSGKAASTPGFKRGA